MTEQSNKRGATPHQAQYKQTIPAGQGRHKIKGGRQVSTVKKGFKWHAEKVRGLVKILATS